MKWTMNIYPECGIVDISRWETAICLHKSEAWLNQIISSTRYNNQLGMWVDKEWSRDKDGHIGHTSSCKVLQSWESDPSKASKTDFNFQAPNNSLSTLLIMIKCTYWKLTIGCLATVLHFTVFSFWYKIFFSLNMMRKRHTEKCLINE